MTPAFALAILGGALIVAGWSNRDLLNVLLSRDEETEGGRAPSLASMLKDTATASDAVGTLIGDGGGQSHPTGGRGRIIGTPHAGTHTMGNWQSDNAIDLGVPRGTPIRAAHSGRVTKVSIRPEGGRVSGSSITITGSGQNITFYTHLSSVLVSEGDTVKSGQKIGESGVANGVPHLHFATIQGDPRRYT